jgi:23S rRNA (cytidine2498-2'-O)-methyltransferase
MNEEQFLFFCTNIGNEKLLKEEIRVFYPEFIFSYSRKGFLTFKNKGIRYSKDTVSQLKLSFATRSGICLGKSTVDDLVDNIQAYVKPFDVKCNAYAIHSFSINTEFELDCLRSLGREKDDFASMNQMVLNLMMLGENEVWIGLHKTDRNLSNYPNSNPDVLLLDDSPSVSFLKIAETLQNFHIKVKPTDLWLDFGSAPGGASHFLLGHGCKVWGIDPAKMDAVVLDHPNFVHIQKAVQDLSQEKLPNVEIDWVHVDINLNPKQTIKEVLRLIKKYNFSIKGVIFTIPIIKMDHVKNIENFEDHFFEWGFTNIVNAQMPSHKKEYVLIAKK